MKLFSSAPKDRDFGRRMWKTAQKERRRKKKAEKKLMTDQATLNIITTLIPMLGFFDKMNIE